MLISACFCIAELTQPQLFQRCGWLQFLLAPHFTFKLAFSIANTFRYERPGYRESILTLAFAAGHLISLFVQLGRGLVCGSIRPGIEGRFECTGVGSGGATSSRAACSAAHVFSLGEARQAHPGRSPKKKNIIGGL